MEASGQLHSLRYPLDRRLDEPQSWSEFCEEKKNLLPLPGIEPKFRHHPAHSPLLYYYYSKYAIWLVENCNLSTVKPLSVVPG
jgi:hypothetical protein